jgi:hypothetical protein
MNDIAYSIAPGDADPEFAGIMTTDAPVGTADVIAAYREIAWEQFTRSWTKTWGSARSSAQPTRSRA